MTDTPREATILNLQRLSTEDGPGLRTTVFFKGCSLRCAWCHNPESITPAPQIQWLERRCIGCDTCLSTCSKGCLTRGAAGLIIDRARCDGDGACAEACPVSAMELLGTRWGLDRLCKDVLKDAAYYQSSGGGVTASGGEPTLQAPFVAAFFERMRSAGVATALDTCGLCSPEALEQILRYTDLVLFDLKVIDPVEHRTFTGHDNTLILENLRMIRRMIATSAIDADLWIRTPLIPGATATPANLDGVGRFIAGSLDGDVRRWELCAFNNLCRDKYARLGMEWNYATTPLLTTAELDELTLVARKSGVDPDRVFATGATAAA